MVEDKNFYSDNEYTIMSEITDNEHITQRELSKKLGISVSTVNALMKKMIKEGLIKMTQVSQKQVFYMLTPVGMLEKANKTVSYLKAHYRAFYQTKEKIKSVLEELEAEHDGIFILMNEDEMGEMIKIAIDEFDSSSFKSKLIVLNKSGKIDFKVFDSPVLVHMMENEEVLQVFVEVEGLTIVNLTERL